MAAEQGSYADLFNRIGGWWSCLTALPPTGSTAAVAAFVESRILQWFIIGATILMTLIAFLYAASGAREWRPARRRQIAVWAFVIALASVLIFSLLLTAMQAQGSVPGLRRVGQFLIVATPLSNFILAALWGIWCAGIVLAVVVLSPILPNPGLKSA